MKMFQVESATGENNIYLYCPVMHISEAFICIKRKSWRPQASNLLLKNTRKHLYAKCGICVEIQDVFKTKLLSIFLPSETACFEFQVSDCFYLSSAEEFVACKIRSSQDGPLCISCVTQSILILFIPLPFIYAASCFSSSFPVYLNAVCFSKGRSSIEIYQWGLFVTFLSLNNADLFPLLLIFTVDYLQCCLISVS